jgi:hypothetical protein
MIFQIISIVNSLNLSIKTKLYALVAVLVGLLASAADIFLAISLSDANITRDYILPLFLLSMRSGVSLLCNLLILKFSVSAELDLKVKSFELSSAKRDNFFKLISYNTAHMALTNCLRMIIEIIVMLVLVVYIYIIDSRIIVASFAFGFLYSIVFFGVFKYSATVRTRAAVEQNIFLSKAASLVALSDRAEQLDVMNFFRDKLRSYSVAYSSLSVKSLFIAQSFKPILEPMVVIVGFYLVSKYSVSGAILYLLYRVASGFVVLINGLPVMDHYFKQYKNATDDGH